MVLPLICKGGTLQDVITNIATLIRFWASQTVKGRGLYTLEHLFTDTAYMLTSWMVGLGIKPVWADLILLVVQGQLSSP